MKIKLLNFMKKIYEPIIPGHIAYNASLLLEHYKRTNELSKELNKRDESNLEGITAEEFHECKVSFLLCGFFDLVSIVAPALFAIDFFETRNYVDALSSIFILAGRYYIYDKQKDTIKKYEKYINGLNQRLNNVKYNH